MSAEEQEATVAASSVAAHASIPRDRQMRYGRRLAPTPRGAKAPAAKHNRKSIGEGAPSGGPLLFKVNSTSRALPSRRAVAVMVPFAILGSAQDLTRSEAQATSLPRDTKRWF